MFLYCANKKVLKFWLFAFKYFTALFLIQRCGEKIYKTTKINLFIKKDFTIRVHTYIISERLKLNYNIVVKCCKIPRKKELKRNCKK